MYLCCAPYLTLIWTVDSGLAVFLSDGGGGGETHGSLRVKGIIFKLGRCDFIATPTGMGTLQV